MNEPMPYHLIESNLKNKMTNKDYNNPTNIVHFSFWSFKHKNFKVKTYFVWNNLISGDFLRIFLGKVWVMTTY